MRLSIFSLLFLVCLGLNSAVLEAAEPAIEIHFIERADGSQIRVYLEGRKSETKKSVFLVLQGSTCKSVTKEGNDRLDYKVPSGMVRMDIEKYDITPNNHGDGEKPCPESYLRHNTVDQRVMDVLQVVNYLRLEAPWWNGKIFLMGISEGATIAALAGPMIPETRGIITINGSIGRPFRDGWADAMVASTKKQGGTPNDLADVRREAENTWIKVRANPTPNEQVFGNGNTYLWWASIIDKRPVKLLLQTSAPILVMQADHDEMNPVEAGRSVAAAFKQAGKTNLTYVELAGLTHGLRTLEGEPGWNPVMQKVTEWVNKQP